LCDVFFLNYLKCSSVCGVKDYMAVFCLSNPKFMLG